jgi:hypothetical protein
LFLGFAYTGPEIYSGVLQSEVMAEIGEIRATEAINFLIGKVLIFCAKNLILSLLLLTALNVYPNNLGRRSIEDHNIFVLLKDIKHIDLMDGRIINIKKI